MKHSWLHARSTRTINCTLPNVFAAARMQLLLHLWAHTCPFGFENIHSPWSQVLLKEHHYWIVPMVNTHILVNLHGGAKKEVCDVCHAIPCTFVHIWYHADDMYFLHEVVFECANSTFCCVKLMPWWWNQIDDVVLGNAAFISWNNHCLTCGSGFDNLWKV